MKNHFNATAKANIRELLLDKAEVIGRKVCLFVCLFHSF